MLFRCICPVLTAETESQFKIISGLDDFWKENMVQLWPGDPTVVWWSSVGPPNLSAVTYLSPQGWGICCGSPARCRPMKCSQSYADATSQGKLTLPISSCREQTELKVKH